jgi:hypothetical protein
VAVPSNKQAVHSIWTIGTTLLYDIAAAMVFYGIVFLLAAWIAGATRPAYAVRRALAPSLRYRLGASYGFAAILFLLLLAWSPTPAMSKPLGILLFAALIVLGIELLRRQTAREFPDAQPGDTTARTRAWIAGIRARRASGEEIDAPRATVDESAAVTTRFDDLEQLASLHDRGVLNDDEFEEQKVLILNGAST